MPKYQTDIAEARKRYSAARSAWSEIHKDAALDLQMVSGDQWEAVVRNARREAGNKPVLTFNQEHIFVQQLENEVRMNRPSIHVNPNDDPATEETAEFFEGKIREIQYRSQADVAYDHAVGCSGSCGLGFIRISVDYCGKQTFDQDAKIERVLDPLSVFFDPSAVRPDFSDAKYCFVRVPMPWSEYRARFRKSQFQGFDDYLSTWSAGTMSDDDGDWATEDHIMLAEYWKVEESSRTLVLLRSTGETGYADEPGFDDPDDYLRTRQETQRKIVMCLMNGQEVLEETEWDGEWIPIVPVLGREMIVKGKRKFLSLVRFVHDSQRLLNASRSGEAEALGMAVRADWSGPTGSFKSMQNAIRSGNLANLRIVEWDPVIEPNTNQVMPPPKREQYEPAIQALSQVSMQVSDDMRKGVGYTDAVLAPSAQNDLSGKAIQKRVQQQSLTNFHFGDNLTRAQWHIGRILIDLISKKFDTPRRTRIVGEDMRTSDVAHTTYRNDDGSIDYVDGVNPQDHHVVNDGSYSVIVTTGPSYDTRRDETFQFMQGIVQAVPNMFPVIGPVMFKYSNAPGSAEIVKVLTAVAPPAVQAILSENQPDEAQMQQQLMMAMQQNQQLKGAMQAALQQLRAKVMEQQTKLQIAAMDNETKLKVATINAQAGLAEQGMKSDHEAALAIAANEMEAIDRMLGMLHESEMAPVPQSQPIQPGGLPIQ